MSKFDKIFIPIVSFVFVVMIVVDSIIFSNMHKKLNEAYGVNKYVSEQSEIDNNSQVITLKVNEGFNIKNNKYSIDCINNFKSSSYKVWANYNKETYTDVYNTVLTDNIYFKVKLKITNISNKTKLAINPSAFYLYAHDSDFTYEHEIILDTELKIVYPNDVIYIDPQLSKNLDIIFEVPDKDENYTLMNDNLFGMKDIDSDWKLVYEIEF